MKLEVGMYCYNKTNRKLGIGKIINFQRNDNVNIRYKNDIELVSIGNLVASFDITDLMEVGDIFKDVLLGVVEVTSIDNQYIFTNSLGLGKKIKFENFNKAFELGNIQIVTKEQFEQNSYKVGE